MLLVSLMFFSQLINGTEFEFKDDSTAAERRELQEIDDENKTWWDKEDLLKHLEMEDLRIFNDDEIDEDDDRSAFDIRASKMDVVASNREGKPIVYKSTVKNGSGDCLTKNSAALYHVTAFTDGADEPFDCSRLRNKPLLTKFNEDPVVHGLLVGLLTMKKGEKAHILVRPEVAFGEIGCPPRIPGDATILYIVEIIKTFDESSLSSFEMMSFEERQAIPFNDIYDRCDKERKSGNTYFKDKRFKEARVRYNRAIKILEDRMTANEEQEKRAKHLLLKLYCNVATVLNELRKHYAASTYCKRALQIDPKNVKALYHYGKASIDNGNYELAKKHLMLAQDLEPGSMDIAKQLTRLDIRLRDQVHVEKKLYADMSKMFK